MSPIESAMAARLAPPHLRGSYLAYALPLSALAAVCFLALPGQPVGEEGLAPA